MAKQSSVLVLDGGFGSELIALGLPAGTPPCVWNITEPDKVLSVHQNYINSGAVLITSNTFSANPWVLGDLERARECCREGVRIAIQARDDAKKVGKKNERKNLLAAFDIGPTGRMLEPYGDLSIADAAAGYQSCAEAILTEDVPDVDVVLLETFTDISEAKSAIIGVKKAYAKANRTLPPIWISSSYEKNARLLSGETPEMAATVLASLGVSAIGCNCGMGPDGMLPIIQKLADAIALPIFANPNAGLPEVADGVTRYTLSPEDFAQQSLALVEAGASFVGGCCGTTPAHIEALAKTVAGMLQRTTKSAEPIRIAGSGKIARIGESPLIVADSVLPLKQEEIAKMADDGEFDEIIDGCVQLEEWGAQAINVCLKGAKNEAAALADLIPQLQMVVKVPLAIDTDDADALSSALLHLRGRAIINACDCTKARFDAVLPVYKRFGGLLIIKTIDEEGVPKTPDLKLKLVKHASSLLRAEGVRERDIVFDPVVLPVRTHMSALYSAANSTRLIKSSAKRMTALGVSNYSLGKSHRAARETYFLSSIEGSMPTILMLNLRSRQIREWISVASANREN